MRSPIAIALGVVVGRGKIFGVSLGAAGVLFAGVLLVIPGVITDLIAVLLLLIPTTKPPKRNPFQDDTSSKSANDDVIEGEYTRED